MANAIAMTAETRNGVGKGAARALRRAGRTPAIVYGAQKDPRPISVDPIVLKSALSRPGFFAQMFDIDVDGETERVLCRDVQLDPLKDLPIHVDFLRVTQTTRLDVEVPVDFINEEESPGLKRGGVLNVVRRTVELSALAGSIPNVLVVDLAGTEIGDSIHISHVALPEGVHPTIRDRDFTVATIAAPTVMPTEDEEEAAEGVEAEATEAADQTAGEDKGEAEES